MPSGDEIKIVFAYLDTLSSNCHTVGDMLDSTSEAMRLSFGENTEVTSSYDDFLDRWDKHRSKLSEGVNGVGDAVTMISDNFRKSEDELVGALECD